MKTQPTRDETFALLKAADPVSAARLNRLADALDELGSEIARRPRPGNYRGRVTRPRYIAALAAAAVVLGAGVATGAVVIGAHTGLFPTKDEEAVGGPGEKLNPAAADFRAAALAAAADIPYPQRFEAWRAFVIEEQAPTTPSGPGGETYPAGLVTTGALRGWFAASAFCAWVREWGQATSAGDRQAAAQAAGVISAAPTWDAVTALDPQPDPARANDPGAVSGTMFGWLLPYIAAVRANDLARVDRLLATGYGDGRCWLSDPNWRAEVRQHKDWATLSKGELAGKYEHYLAQSRS